LAASGQVKGLWTGGGSNPVDQTWKNKNRVFPVRTVFGTDLMVLPSDQLDDQMRQYQEFSRKEILAALPDADRDERADAAPEFTAGAELSECETVGVVYDEIDGLNFYADFGLVEAVFTDPTLLRRRLYKQRLLDYLDDDSVSPLPFRRLADRDPQRASVLFQKLLRRPDFDWPRDGEGLLRERKGAYFDRPPRPSISPISERLAPYVKPRNRATTVRESPGRTPGDAIGLSS
jgi:hypothetical protein